MDFQDSSMGMDSTTRSEALRIDSVHLESKIHRMELEDLSRELHEWYIWVTWAAGNNFHGSCLHVALGCREISLST